jgi:hypothetical protein
MTAPFGPEWDGLSRADLAAAGDRGDGPTLADRYDVDPPARLPHRPVPPPCTDCLMRRDHYAWCSKVGGPGFEVTFGLAPALGGAA